jgi:hypothetical protein
MLYICCRYLAAKCLAEVDEWDECLSLLGDGELDDDLQDAVGPMLTPWHLQLQQQIALTVGRFVSRDGSIHL